MEMINIDFIKENLIKSPLNYVGGKFKLLPQILPLFPDNINTFVDLFSGGCNVGINVNAKQIICNDILLEVINFCNNCKSFNSENVVKQIENIVEEFNLSKENQDNYLKLRQFYNQGNKEWSYFYALICHSFSNQIRFNSKGEFNLPFGKRTFNPVMKDNLIKFVNRLKEININFTNLDFRKIDISKLDSNDFLYADPPYLITCATYNEKNGWKEQDEKDLLNLLDKLNDNSVKFALSNVLESKGNSNDILKEWSKKYIVHRLNAKYGNANYQRKEKDNSTTLEVLVTNY
jgi:DNA adenine methylase Dam